MSDVQSFSVVPSRWPNESGESYFTITDGAETRGEFKTRRAAEEGMMDVIINWRRNS